MNAYESTEIESTDVEPRTERALTECMTVLALGGDVYSVTTQSGSEYWVDLQEERCTCPDHKHRNIQCKHLRRVVFATGEQPIPADVNDIDPLLGEQVDGEPRAVETDGGLVDTGDMGDHEEGNRPGDCQCWDVDIGLPCWPCFREGYRSQNPVEPKSSTGANDQRR